jgi:hypothetical protein
MNQVLKPTLIAHMPGQNEDINPMENEVDSEELALV